MPFLTFQTIVRKYYRFFLYAAAMLCFNLFFFRIAFVQGESMLPTLHDKQMLLLRIIACEPSKGDIIVTTKQNPFRRSLIKRVIATQGDHIQLTAHEVYLNGQPLDEPYVAYVPTYTPLELTVPDGCIFIMGDNRDFSKDSRDIGCLPASEAIGIIIR